MDERVLIGSEGLLEVDQASSTDAECKERDRKYVSKKKKKMQMDGFPRECG